MAGDMRKSKSPEELEALHQQADAMVKSYHYEKPSGIDSGKGNVFLGRGKYIRGGVQIVKKDGGENNLHYHSNGDSFWMVLKGRIRFYGPDDMVIGEYGPHEGLITPIWSRYWFENAGEDDAEILHVSARADAAMEHSGRTDLAEQRFKLSTTKHFDASKD
jgi:mannose-6-phosphate isomerase-like protein (cupin superfamily)